MTKEIENAIAAHIKEEREQVARYAAEVMKSILLRYKVNPTLLNPHSPQKLLEWGVDDLNAFRKHYGLPELAENLMNIK